VPRMKIGKGSFSYTGHEIENAIETRSTSCTACRSAGPSSPTERSEAR
jgi:hypothetical protein